MEYVLRGNIRLERGGFVRIQGASGTLVRVNSGAVWITEEGDARDHFVPAGSRFKVASNRLTLVSALGGSNLEMRTPRKRSFATRLAHAWRSWFVPGARPTTAAL